VTFRLADALPKRIVDDWQKQLKYLPKTRANLELRQRVEEYLDSGYGACHLRDSRIGELVEKALLFFDGTRYRLHAWVVMPNHVHVLFSPMREHTLSGILHSWKSFTAKKANQILDLRGQFWEEDYFDRFIRDETHFAAVVEYIECNPEKAVLCSRKVEWPYSSARYRSSESHADADFAGETPALP
jgi:REP element-mobilizing transposase RayT